MREPAARRGAREGSREDPRWKRTREAILKAGEELFGRHQADGVSTDEIIRAARISKQSFYNHFPDKDALARELLRRARDEIDALVTAANQGQADPARRLVTGLCVYAAQAVRNPHQAGMMSRLLLDDATPESSTNSPVVADIIAGLEQGRLAVFTLETGLGFILGVGEALIRRVVADPRPVVATLVAQQFTTLVLRAFGLPPIEAELIASEASDRIIRRNGASAVFDSM